LPADGCGRHGDKANLAGTDKAIAADCTGGMTSVIVDG
jgi:hypothetical protein